MFVDEYWLGMNIASKGKKGKKNFLNITFESGFLDRTSPS